MEVLVLNTESYIPSQTFRKFSTHCLGGAGRYRAEALQELAAQFGQTFGLQ